MMRISVIVPCFNAEPWIADALLSAARQTLQPHEIIVVDDGSTDRSLQCVIEAGVNVNIIECRHLGGAGARNAGIRAATGDWIAFLDADDIWYSRHLERAAALLTHGDAAYLANNDSLDLFGNIEERKARWPFATPTAGLDGRDFVRLFLQNQFFSMASVVVKRSVLLAVGLLDETQTRRHDIEMWLRVVACNTWAFDPRSAYAYRQGAPQCLSSDYASAQFFFLRALDLNHSRFEGPDFRRLLQIGARRAVAAALDSGSQSQLDDALRAARKWLSPTSRALLATLVRMPGTFRLANRVRRALRRA